MERGGEIKPSVIQLIFNIMYCLLSNNTYLY